VRAESYERYAWPRAMAPVFRRNGLWISLIAALSVAAFIAGFAAWHEPSVLFSSHAGRGAFYRLMPHNTMVLIFGLVFTYAMLALAMSLRNFWNDIGDTPKIARGMAAFWQAIKDAGSLRYLDGGGVGCYGDDEKPTDIRRIYHHLTFYGFMLCFLSTSTATLYHYLAGLEAPYPWYDLPVLFGTAGGIGLLVGPVGLLKAKWSRDPELSEPSRYGMDVAFLAMLFLTSLTGLLLLVLRETAAMPLLLAAHLGVVFALFLSMPYGKFVHGLYRFLALIRYAGERNGELAQVHD
jgi:citrate/tricarballylate utilization protein